MAAYRNLFPFCQTTYAGSSRRAWPSARRGRCFCRTARRSRPRGRSPRSRRPQPKAAGIAPDLGNKILAQRPGRPEPYHRLDVGATGAAIESHLDTPAATQGVRGQGVAFRSADDRRAGAAEDELIRACVHDVENHRVLGVVAHVGVSARRAGLHEVVFRENS